MSSILEELQQRRDRSAEMLRLVLPLISAHGSDFSPPSYALWYTYVVGGDAELAAALDSVVQARSRLTNAETERLFATLVLAGEGKALRLIRKALLRVVGGVSRATTQTRESSDRFILELSRATDGAAALEPLPTTSHLVHHARVMSGSLASLNVRLTESQAQIEELREQLERARQESLVDPLTRLSNRRAFDEALGGLIARGDQDRAPTSLVVLDIDHFKRINDELGHVFGDHVLRMVAGVLAKQLKGKDTVARFGGEEFAVLLPGTPEHAAYRVAEQLREAVAAIHVSRAKSKGAALQITVSCGVATHVAAEGADAFISRADAALYEAKRRGRNCVIAAGK